MASRPGTFASLRGLRFLRLALLWLALALGLAQTAALAHGYSHGPGETATQAGGKHPGGLAHCASCIVAAGIGGAPPPAPALLLAAPAQQAPRVAATATQHGAPQPRPYAIRAPPVLAS